ncbi:MAG: hypothetical protein V7K40_26865 [Nostoc sp.]
MQTQYAWVSAKKLSGLTEKLSETLIPTLREAAAASMCPILRSATSQLLERLRPKRTPERL